MAEQKFLNIIRLTVKFVDAESYEIDQHDLFEVFSKLGFDCQNIVTIRKNSYFVVTNSAADAFELFKKLNNHFIEPIKAHIEVMLCAEGDDAPARTEEFKSLFEVEVPELAHFDVRRRFMGVDDYNFERLKNLCDKEYFDGYTTFEFLGVDAEFRSECMTY